MEFIGEEVTDLADLEQQLRAKWPQADPNVLLYVSACLYIGRELKWYRQWAEENHSP